MAQVVSLSAEIAALNTNIIAVSFGTAHWAEAWLEKTQAPFPIWLDPQKQSYPTYGMQRSVWASWGPKNLWYYARALARGEKPENTGEDTNQLGGNFIIDRDGIVRFAYPSEDPTDRPSMTQLLAVLRNLE